MNIPRDKRFYEYGEWKKLLDETPIQDQPKDVYKQFIRDSIEDSYRLEYYRTLEWADHDGPDWEDLTDEQRENIKQIQLEHARDMHDFGIAIASNNDDEIDAAGKKLIGK